MQPEEREANLLWDMREAACEIAQFIKGVSYEEFESNKVLRYAVERQILVIVEAAGRVSSTLKDAHPEIQWCSIVAQRNILAHEIQASRDSVEQDYSPASRPCTRIW